MSVLVAGGAECDPDFESSFGSGLCRDGGAVGVGDGLDDGQAEAVSGGLSHPLASRSLEWLEEPVDLARSDHRSSVTDGDSCSFRGRDSGDLDPSTGVVMADGVVDEVHHEDFNQLGIADRRGGHERRVDLNPSARRLLSSAGKNILAGGGQI